MLINLNKLNESLEAKYLNETIEEDVELNEAFGDMPSWLSKRILTTKYNKYDGQHRKDYGVYKKDQWGSMDLDSKNPNVGPNATYTNARNAKGDQSLFGQFLAHGINMDSVKIIEGEKPAKRTDPRLKEPNIPIFLFENGQVYAKGINDNEEYSGDNSYRAFKYLPMKELLSDQVVKFAYIDGNDDENFKVAKKKEDRAKSRMDLPPQREKDKAGVQSWRGNWDKSGYRQIPSADRYRDKLAELKCTKIYDVLDAKRDLLEETKEELANIMLSTDIKSMKDDQDYATAFTAYENIYEKFQRATSNYIDVLKAVDRIVNDENMDEERKRQELIYLINYNSDYSRLMSYTKEIEQMAPSVFNSIIDWI